MKRIAIILSFIVGLFIVDNVSATPASFINCTRTYTQNNAISTNPCNNGSSSTITPVANIISDGQSFFANLNRFTGDITFTGTNASNKYNRIRLVVRFSQLNYYGMPGTFVSSPAPYIYYVKSDGTGEIIGCPLEIQTADETRFVCDISTDNYTAIIAGSFIWGEAVSTSVLATIGPLPYNPNSLRLFGLDYEATTTSDPMVAGQNTIISQNDIMINQNQQMINSMNTNNAIQQQTYDYISDTTPPSANTEVLGNAVGWLPPGPVDSILTLPLQLLQGIINVFTGSAACTPLNFPVPFVDYNLQLPCVNILMDEIGFTPIWSIVGGVISAIIIWQTLKWLYEYVDRTLTFRENNSGLWGGL